MLWFFPYLLVCAQSAVVDIQNVAVVGELLLYLLVMLLIVPVPLLVKI